ncbi:T9SS C-terminal target domain-containing protein [Chryseobacterium nematophagum]|uniref:T9SS C-terminal target domain-containing protein n=1 Tax=Chryseobacterium nematophagum TaxID=2305228 RepID=A0A3M7L6I6_9FLAO|nr:choice-of-anchor J domain-containing protein [Chryseobacterium nematophagum]RMZ58338.1 T9SS C-terminal target domain-containing protein [Chryseobacterium nematophagum]
MRKLLLNVLLSSLPIFSFAQIFQENFDGNGPGIAAWTTIDGDGLTPANDVSFITNGWNRIDRDGVDGGFGGPAGNYAAMSTSWYSPPGTSNDWLISPQMTISGASPTLYWDAKAQDDDYPDGYKVMLAPNGGNTIADFTVELYNSTGENPYWTSRAVNLSSYIGQNIRFAFVNNNYDNFLLLVDNIKVDYTYVEPPLSYCGPLVFNDGFSDGDEPITLVNFAGINNTSDATQYLGIHHENFLSQIASVAQDESYTITLKGNTVGNYTNRFAVFIDWNQNGILNDSQEVYLVTQTILNSTGIDDIQAQHTINVPLGATLGNTRMRVKKIFGTLDLSDPCVGADYGQAEDYTVTVTAALAVNETSKRETLFKVHPNPVTDILKIDCKSVIKNIIVLDMAGREVLRSEINKSSFNVDLSKLTSGTYTLSAQTEQGFQSTKIIKK